MREFSVFFLSCLWAVNFPDMTFTVQKELARIPCLLAFLFCHEKALNFVKCLLKGSHDIFEPLYVYHFYWLCTLKQPWASEINSSWPGLTRLYYPGKYGLLLLSSFASVFIRANNLWFSFLIMPLLGFQPLLWYLFSWGEFGSVLYSSMFWKNLRNITVKSYRFGRIF